MCPLPLKSVELLYISKLSLVLLYLFFYFLPQCGRPWLAQWKQFLFQRKNKQMISVLMTHLFCGHLPVAFTFKIWACNAINVRSWHALTAARFYGRLNYEHRRRLPVLRWLRWAGHQSSPEEDLGSARCRLQCHVNSSCQFTAPLPYTSSMCGSPFAPSLLPPLMSSFTGPFRWASSRPVQNYRTSNVLSISSAPCPVIKARQGPSWKLLSSSIGHTCPLFTKNRSMESGYVRAVRSGPRESAAATWNDLLVPSPSLPFVLPCSLLSITPKTEHLLCRACGL